MDPATDPGLMAATDPAFQPLLSNKGYVFWDEPRTDRQQRPANGFIGFLVGALLVWKAPSLVDWLAQRTGHGRPWVLWR